MKFFNATSISIPRSSASVFWALSGLVAVFLALYIYFITSSVIFVVVRAEVEQDVAVTHSRISELESSYLKKTAALTEEYARSAGFAQIDQKSFATRDTALAADFSLAGGNR